MIRHLLDTDTCVELIRGKSEPILSRLRRCQIGSVGISSVTFAELHYGVAKSRDPGRNFIALTQFCATTEILPFDDRAASRYGQVRADLERDGLAIGALDTLIAAHALSLGAILVSGNEREFRRVEGLQVENWVSPA